MADACVEPTCGPAWTTEKKNFFSSVSILRPDRSFIQFVGTGDLVVIEDNKVPANERFVKGASLRVAQVLGFCFARDEKSVFVQFLWPFKAVKDAMTKSDRSSFTSGERPELLLFRKSDVVVRVFSVSKIQPVLVKQDDIDVRESKVNHFDDEFQIEEWRFQKRNFLVNQGGKLTKSKAPLTDGSPPASVEEGWKHFPDDFVTNPQKLGTKFKKAYQSEKQGRFQHLDDSSRSETKQRESKSTRSASRTRTTARKRSPPRKETSKVIAPTKIAKKAKAVKKRKVSPECDRAQPKKRAVDSLHAVPGPVVYTNRRNGVDFFQTIKLSRRSASEFCVGDFVHVVAKIHVGQILSLFRENDTILAEVRWFYYFSELPKDVGLPDDFDEQVDVIEVDEHVGTVEAITLKNTVRLSSTKRRGCVLCRYGFSFENYTGGEGLYRIQHWDGQKKSLNGLDCPKAWPGKIPRLLKAYGGLHHKYDQNKAREDSPVMEWSKELLELDTAIPNDPQLHCIEQRSYWFSMKVRLDSNRSVLGIQRSLAVRLGDIVCMARSGEGAMCHPFLGPWRAAQVLSIYCDKSGGLKLEVRWFRRMADFSEDIRGWMPLCSENSSESIFETNLVESDVSAHHVLGKVRIRLPSETKKDFVATNLHELPVGCQYYSLDEPARFQPIPTKGVVNSAWFSRLVERGLFASRHLKNNHQLAQAVQFHLDYDAAHDKSPSLFNSITSFLSNDGERLEIAGKDPKEPSMFLSCNGGTVLGKFDDEARVMHISSQQAMFRWKIRVGDIVAVENKLMRVAKPFTVGWMPAQVLAILIDPSHQDQGIRIQVRLLYRSEDVGAPSQQPPSLDGLAVIFSSDDVHPHLIMPSDVLGPVHVVPGAIEDQELSIRRNVWDAHFPGIPSALFVYSGHINAVNRRIEPLPFNRLIQNAIEVSPLYTSESRSKLLLELSAECGLADGDRCQLPLLCLKQRDQDYETKSQQGDAESDLSSKTWFPRPPIYRDNRDGIEFFDEINVVPPSSITRHGQSSGPTGRTWTVRLGDLVVLRFHGKSAGDAKYLPDASSNLSSRESLFPGPWTAGEVVNMWKISGENKLEIRWFFRNDEIPGRSKTSAADFDTLSCEEIFESDLYEQVSASNVWAPILLHDRKRELKAGRSAFRLPVVEFFCRQTWSVARKCLLPMSRADKRVERGREKSPTLKNNLSLKYILENQTDVPVSCVRPKLNSDSLEWKRAFKEVVAKLSLTNASKEAHKSTSSIIGRLKEKKELQLFLRDALRGQSGTGKRPTLFVAGAPGSGKTSCVKAVVHDLQSNTKQPLCRRFNFITLNGMETRHPHDAYAKLLDELAIDNSRCTPKTAARKLEQHFCTKASDLREPEEVYVVLVDEIDYLVTPSQEVLYDLFNWPIRSLEIGSKRRLIVIAVSNTLTLPDNLHPRVKSRVGAKRVFFKAYTDNETKAILSSKIRAASPDYPVFRDDAILYAAKKTSALSGDIRKAFNICKQAAEMIMTRSEAQEGNMNAKPIVEIKDVLAVSRESFNSAASQAISTCSSFEALLLVSLGSLGKTTGREYGGFDIEEIVTKMASIADALGDAVFLPPPSLEETLGIVARLGEIHLLSLETPRNTSLSHSAGLSNTGGAWPIVTLPPDEVTILLALKETKYNKLAEKYLARSSYSG